MSISQRIKERRAVLGMNQKALADSLGVTQGAIAQIESGVRTPSIGLLPGISKTLRISIDYLVTGESSELMDIGALNAADRLLIRRFYEYLLWLKEKAG